MAKKIKSNQVASTVYLNASNPFYLRDKPRNKYGRRKEECQK